MLIWKNQKNSGIFNLRTGDRILMKFDIYKIFSQSSYFKSRPDLLTLGRVGGGKPEILQNAHECRRYVIDVAGLDPLSLVKLGGGVQCFGEFGAS